MLHAAAFGDDAEAALPIAKQIEEEVAARHAGKDYTTKARSLVFNISKNGDLRHRLLLKELSATELVTASVSDLATDAQKLARQGSIVSECTRVTSPAHDRPTTLDDRRQKRALSGRHETAKVDP